MWRSGPARTTRVAALSHLLELKKSMVRTMPPTKRPRSSCASSAERTFAAAKLALVISV